MLMKMLNVACGSRYHTDWVNIDFSPADKNVKKVNLLGTLPFENESFDVAYSSHFLEHLSLQQAKNICLEIHRILKPNGIFRVVVPDLENMATYYLRTLKAMDSFLSNGGGG